MHYVWLYLVQEKLARVIHAVTTTQFNHPIKDSSETATGPECSHLCTSQLLAMALNNTHFPDPALVTDMHTI